MRMFWTIQVGLGVVALAGMTAFGVACGSSTTAGTDTSTDDTSTDDTSTDDTSTDDTSTDDTSTDDTDTDTADDCTKACDDLMSAGGCADLCSTLHNGATTPNFCEGQNALSQCATCLAGIGVSSTAGTCSGM